MSTQAVHEPPSETGDRPSRAPQVRAHIRKVLRTLTRSGDDAAS